MSFIKSFFTGSTEKLRDDEISKIVPLADCSHDCESCSTKFPSSLRFADGDIYKSTKPIDLHFVVPTGKADWQSNISDTKGTIEYALNKWKDKEGSTIIPGGNIRISDSSIPLDFSDPRYQKKEIYDLLILPYFVWIKKIDLVNLHSVLDELIPILIKLREEDSKEIPSSIQGFDIIKSNALSYIFLCSHTTRDKRCGVTAPLMKKEMDFRLRDTGNYRDTGDNRPDGVHVVYINHVGGHKFAANVIIHLRSGETIWLAKCTPQNCVPIIDETVLGGGKVWGDLVRMVQKDKAIQW